MNARLLLSALMLFALPVLGSATPPEQPDAWPKQSFNGVNYYSLNQLSSFYKLNPAPARKASQQQLIRNSAASLGLTPGSREATVSGYRVLLSYPAAQNAQGELLVSEMDVVKLLDPLLRPTYIPERRDIKTVVIDPGHGGTDVGNKSPQLREAEFTLKLAKELADALKKQGINVVLTRSSNHNVSDVERVEIAKNTPSALFVSLHVNKGRSDMAGIETYTAAPVAPGERAMVANRYDAANAALAFALHSHAVAATKAPDRACRRARFTLLNTLTCPAAMIMVGYGSHEKEADSLCSDSYRAELIRGLCNGILAFKTAIRPGAGITIPPPPQKAEPAQKPAAKPAAADTESAKPATPKKKAPARRNSRSRRSRR